MRIENQVCSLERAKKLQEFGINYMDNAQYYYVDYSTNSGHEFALSRPFLFGDNSWLIVQNVISDEIQSELNEDRLNACGAIYPAFTVAELGVMLTVYRENVAEVYFEPITKRWFWQIIKHNTFEPIIFQLTQGFKTEVDARGALLSVLLERNEIMAEDVNNQLKEK